MKEWEMMTAEKAFITDLGATTTIEGGGINEQDQI